MYFQESFRQGLQCKVVLKDGFHLIPLTENSPQRALLVLGICVHTRECQVCFHPSGS